MLVKIGDCYINPEQVAAIHPDRGDFYQGIRVSDPKPGLFFIVTSGGDRFGASEDEIAQLVNASRPHTYSWTKAGDVPLELHDPDFLEVQDTPEEAAQLLAWLDKRHDLILAYGKGKWRIHLETMDAKDPEWTCLHSSGWDSPIEALRAAHKAFCDGR